MYTILGGLTRPRMTQKESLASDSWTEIPPPHSGHCWLYWWLSGSPPSSGASTGVEKYVCTCVLRWDGGRGPHNVHLPDSVLLCSFPLPTPQLSNWGIHSLKHISTFTRQKALRLVYGCWRQEQVIRVLFIRASLTRGNIKPQLHGNVHQNSSPKYLQVAISLLLTKITVFVFFITSPRQRLRKLLVPLLLSKTGTNIFLVILLHQRDDE